MFSSWKAKYIGQASDDFLAGLSVQTRENAWRATFNQIDTHEREKLVMAVAYLIVGFAGAGKTTFAKQLASKKNAVRFTPDDWMERIFSEPIDIDGFSRYFGRICDLVWNVALQLLENNQDVILDIGFWTRESRDCARRLLTEHRIEYRLVFVDCKDAIIHERLARRHNSFWNAETVVEKLKLFERPGEDEDCELIFGDI